MNWRNCPAAHTGKLCSGCGCPRQGYIPGPLHDGPNFPPVVAIVVFAVVFMLAMAATAFATDYRRDPVYGWDPRCDTGARYEAMAAGYNCSAPKPGRSVWQAAKCEAYSATASSCLALRGLVKVNGLAAVKATARKCGATEAQIAERESSCK